MGDGEAVEPPIEQPAEQSTKGGYVPQTYVKGKARKKALSDIRADLEREISALYDEAEEEITPQLIERAKKVEKKAESLFDWAESQHQNRTLVEFQKQLLETRKSIESLNREIEETQIMLLMLVA